jgi:hypothetical protein
VIGEGRVIPAGLGVAEEQEMLVIVHRAILSE